jgi:hypothetical protein
MKRIAASSIVLLLAASSAIAQDVLYNFMDTHFEKFKTYKWVEIKGAQEVDELKDKEIKAALDTALAKKRLTKTDAVTADLYIGYQAGVLAEKQLAFYNTDWGYGPGWYLEGWYKDYYVSKGQTSTIYAGQLAVDMYDSKNHYLAWRGVVSKALDPAATPDMQEKILKKSVAKLLTRYPPPIDVPGATGTHRVPILSYYHSFDFLGRSANVSALLPDGVGTFQGKVLDTDLATLNGFQMAAIVHSRLSPSYS